MAKKHTEDTQELILDYQEIKDTFNVPLFIEEADSNQVSGFRVVDNTQIAFVDRKEKTLVLGNFFVAKAYGVSLAFCETSIPGAEDLTFFDADNGFILLGYLNGGLEIYHKKGLNRVFNHGPVQGSAPVCVRKCAQRHKMYLKKVFPDKLLAEYKVDSKTDVSVLPI